MSKPETVKYKGRTIDLYEGLMWSAIVDGKIVGGSITKEGALKLAKLAIDREEA